MFFTHTMHLSFYSSLLAWWPVSIEKLTSLSNLLAEKLRTSACLGFCSPCITCYNLIPCPTKRSKSLFYMGLSYFATLLLITSLIEKTWRDILLRTSMNSALLRLLRLQLGSKLQVAQRHKPHGLDKPELEKHGFTMYATFPSKTTRKPSSLHPDIVWIHLKIFTVRTLDYLSTHSWATLGRIRGQFGSWGNACSLPPSNSRGVAKESLLLPWHPRLGNGCCSLPMPGTDSLYALL